MKKTKTLAELIEAEQGRDHPNPFVLLCVEQVARMKAVTEAVPDLHQLDRHAACIAAFAMLQVEPTYENLKALRTALDEFEEPFMN